MIFRMLRKLVVSSFVLSSAMVFSQTPGAAIPPVRSTLIMPSDPAEILKVAMDRAGLIHDGITPWHLAAKIQLYDAKGNPSEQGIVEEDYAGPKNIRIVTKFPSFTSTKITNADGTFVEGPESPSSYVVELALKQLIDPKPSADYFEGVTVRRDVKSFGKVQLTCLMLARPIPNTSPEAIPLGLFPTYCTNLNNPILRAAYTSSGDISSSFNAIQRFEGHDVAWHLTLTEEKDKVAEITVTDLHSMEKPSPEIFIAGTSAKVENTSQVDVPKEVTSGNVIYKTPPIYPQTSRRAHKSGTVVIAAVIGKDGIIRNLRILSTPDVDIAIAATNAVRQWRYKPYLLRGAPVEVNTTVQVNFGG
jgi:TonB family protein